MLQELFRLEPGKSVRFDRIVRFGPRSDPKALALYEGSRMVGYLASTVSMGGAPFWVWVKLTDQCHVASVSGRTSDSGWETQDSVDFQRCRGPHPEWTRAWSERLCTRYGGSLVVPPPGVASQTVPQTLSGVGERAARVGL
jgi:hypothetical protein